jgi:hypothetical protein
VKIALIRGRVRAVLMCIGSGGGVVEQDLARQQMELGKWSKEFTDFAFTLLMLDQGYLSTGNSAGRSDSGGVHGVPLKVLADKLSHFKRLHTRSADSGSVRDWL